MLAAGIGIFGSCTPDGGTIYATIETETKTVDNTLPNTLTIGDMVSPASSTYYVAAGRLYKGTLASGTITWSSLATAPASSLATTLAYDVTALWGGFITAGSVLGLYSSAPSPFTTDFTKETDATVAAKQVYGLSVANGTELFAVTAVVSGPNYVYELEHHTGTWAGAPLVTNMVDPIVGVASAGVTNYFMASGGTIYSSANGTDNFPTVSQLLAAGDKAQGIFGDETNNRVFVTTKSGGLYYTANDGGAWTHVAAPVINSVAVPFLSIAGPIDAGNDKYLVGSDGFGYFVFSVSGGTFTRFSDSAVLVYAASIRRILVDGTGPYTVLMGTNGAGLWRATFDAAGALSSDWTHE